MGGSRTNFRDFAQVLQEILVFFVVAHELSYDYGYSVKFIN